MARLPTVRDLLGVDAAQLGLLLLIGGMGTFFGALTVGALIARFGELRIYIVGTIASALAFSTLAIAMLLASPMLFGIAELALGYCAALINVPINISATAIERLSARTVLPVFHACFSIGAASGALLAAACAALGVHIGWQILVVTLVVTLARAFLLRTALEPVRLAKKTSRTSSPSAKSEGAIKSVLSAWLEPRTLLLGVVLLSAGLAEGGAGTWLPMAVVDGFNEREAVGAAAYGTFVAAMTVCRFLSIRVIDRFGRVAVLRASGIAALVGLLLVVFGPNLVWAWFGIVFWGFGAALGNPIALSAASDDLDKAGQRVSVVTSFSTITSLAAPPVLGLLVDEYGARHALLVLAVAMVLSISVAGTVRKPDEPRSRP